MCQIVNIFSFCLNTPFFCDTEQLLRIFYLVRSFWFCTVQCVADLTAVIRMRCRSACCKFQVVTSYDTVYVASADTSWCLRCDTARSHCTDTAADTLLTKFTVWGLFCCTVLPCICSYFFSCFQKFLCSRFEFFNGCQFKVSHHLPPCLWVPIPQVFSYPIRPHGIWGFEINPLTASRKGLCFIS